VTDLVSAVTPFLSVCFDWEAAGKKQYASWLDFKAIGLDGYGKAGGFYDRQIARLVQVSKAQEAVSGVPVLPRLAEMTQWFGHNSVKDESTIVHGDYKMDNLVRPRFSVMCVCQFNHSPVEGLVRIVQ
jgi:hypothetical protein